MVNKEILIATPGGEREREFPELVRFEVET